MKKFVALIICAVLVFSFAACDNKISDKNNTAITTTATVTDATTTTTEVPVTTTSLVTTTEESVIPEDKKITPLLYKVTDDDNNVTWLFGSIHIGKEYFYPLPDYVIDAYESSDALAVEADMVSFASDFTAQTTALSKLVYTDSTTIKDHLPKETYDKAVEILEEMGVYNSLLDYYMPFMWSSMIESGMTEQAGLDANLGIDMHFLNDAHENNKEIIEVESAEFQYNMMASFSAELQCIILEEAIYSYEHPVTTKVGFKSLLHLWESGDEDALYKYLNTETEFESDEEETLYNEYNNEMITNRNISMTDFAEDALKSGKEVFICVGAAHVVGEGGMAGQLKDRGYNVEIVR
ncbi:MAG: TraB/GumN family protein [Ruminococcus sp.]|nr:TraB/GumN family protein [Ruminococcus sp.]